MCELPDQHERKMQRYSYTSMTLWDIQVRDDDLWPDERAFCITADDEFHLEIYNIRSIIP